MGLVNPTQSNSGDTIEAADINTPINQLAAVLNGGIDANNLADSGVTTSKVGDAAVTPAKLQSGTGSSWVWSSFTPTVTLSGTGTANGNASISGAYIQVGKTVHYWVRYVVGSTTAFGGGMTGLSFTLPVAASAGFAVSTNSYGSGMANISGSTFEVTTQISSPTVAFLVCKAAGGSYISYSVISSIQPSSWVSGSSWGAAGTYEVA